MPTYSYRCDTCGDQFDTFQKFSDDPLTECPSCDGTVRRVIQPVGVVFKGSGWYINDSRKPSDSDASKSVSNDKDKDKAKPSDTAKSATTENGSAAKTESAKPTTPAPA
ncbi:MAG: FmdB family zinc ribbon protein [Thermomicrobiales bacterium]|jgi:putative FmdB family regulatory protein